MWYLVAFVAGGIVGYGICAWLTIAAAGPCDPEIWG